MYYIAISKTGFGNDMLFWDKKAQAFINKLPDMKKDAYKNFSATNNKRVKARHVWQMLVDEHVENGGKRDELGLYVLGESYVEDIANGIPRII